MSTLRPPRQCYATPLRAGIALGLAASLYPGCAHSRRALPHHDLRAASTPVAVAPAGPANEGGGRRAQTDVAVTRDTRTQADGRPVPPGATRDPGTPADPSTLAVESLVRLALRENPALRAARAEAEAIGEALPRVRSLPDPRLSARYFAEEIETRVGPQEFALGLHQRLPAWGARERAADVVDARHATAASEVRMLRRRVAREVRSAWAERWELERRIAVVAESVALFETLEKVLLPLFASGEARYTDVLRTAVELGRLRDRERALVDRRAVLDARLNAALGRSTEEPLPQPDTTPPAELLAHLELEEGAARRALDGANPELEVLANALLARSAELDEAEHARRPEITVGLEWIATGRARSAGVDGSGDDPLAATLALDLPLRAARYAAGEREARARVRAARERLESARADLAERLAEERYQLRDANRRIALYEGELLPRALEAFQATQAGFHAGKATFTDVVDTERVRLELQLELARARADLAIARARVWELAGEDEPYEDETAEPQEESR